MTEPYSVIKYKWDCGFYQIEDMIKMVQNKILNEQQFFDITRYAYNSVKNVII